MPRYDFRCEACESVQEHTFSMAEKPDVLACECGGEMHSMFSSTVEILAKGNTREFKLDASCVPIGWERGNDGQKQAERYRQIVAESRKMARAGDKKAIKNGVRLVGKVPRELDRLRKKQYGKDYYQTDTVEKLKSDGLYLHGDR